MTEPALPLPDLGMIEGRFGRLWTADERGYVVDTLAAAGYRFYHYGPKADAALRRTWRTAHDPAQTDALAQLSARVRAGGMRFGMALTPIGSTHPFDDTVRADLTRRIADLDAIGIDDLAILFDDLRGDLPELAARQADVVNFCAGISRATRVYMCPTYYSDDPVLDRVFGARPADYLGDLGRMLDPAVQVYWTGEEVCAKEIGVGHLRRVAEALGRRVCLWDNYPVNDGVRMSRHLHLRAFTGRSAAIAPWLTGHAINPAIQAHLTCIPALTLPMLYRQGPDYAYAAAFAEAATTLLGRELAEVLQSDLLTLQDTGHDRLNIRIPTLQTHYATFQHPAALEIIRWLNACDLMANYEVKTQ